MPETLDRIEKHVFIEAPPAKVWRAISDSRQFGAWFRVELDGPFEPGAVLHGRILEPGYEHLTAEFGVQEVEPERLLSFRWHPGVPEPGADLAAEPTTLVTFTLTPEGEGTVVRVVESGFEGIPLARRAQAFEGNAEGWAIQMERVRTYVLEH